MVNVTMRASLEEQFEADEALVGGFLQPRSLRGLGGCRTERLRVLSQQFRQRPGVAQRRDLVRMLLNTSCAQILEGGNYGEESYSGLTAKTSLWSCFDA